MAIEQLQEASSIEEYQQVGILIRDAWVEFIQKLFSSTFVAQQTSTSDKLHLKDKIKYIVRRWSNFPEALIEVCNSLINLSNKIQHKTNIDAHSVKWCVLTTLFVMSIMLELDSQHDKLADRRYYKCPKCGGLNLIYKKDIEVSYDGPGPDYEIWNCEDCDWEDFVYLA